MTRRSKGIIAVFVLVVLVILVGLLWKRNPQSGTQQASNQTQQVATNNPSSTQVVVNQPGQNTNDATSVTPQKVTAIALSQENNLLLDALGTVKPKEQTKIFPVAAGQVAGFYKEEGDTVQKGETLLTLAGINGGKSPVLSQLDIASANYQAALKNLQNTLASNNAGVQTAQLQLESAIHQMNGSSYDVQVLEQNQAAARDSSNLLRDSFNTNQQKNSYDLEKARLGIESLQNSINTLENQRIQTIDDLQQQINNAPADQKAALEQTLQKQEADFDKNLATLNDQLNQAQVGYQSAQEAITLGENQILQQMIQSDSQGKVFYLNEQGMQEKLGLTGDSSDAVKLAQEALNAALVRNATALSQAKAQADVAKANLDLAQSQADALTVRAPFDGVVSEVDVKNGDQVAPQTALLQITGSTAYELKVGVSPENAQKIQPYSLAQVQIGGRFINVPIRAVSPNVDATTKLVTVTIALPKISFRNNQNIKVKIPLVLNESNNSSQGFFIPLDAVIIGTEEQYVFILQDGKAKKVDVVTGVMNGDRIQILGGLSANDLVIVQGAKDLVDGQEVAVDQGTGSLN